MAAGDQSAEAEPLGKLAAHIVMGSGSALKHAVLGPTPPTPRLSSVSSPATSDLFGVGCHARMSSTDGA